MSLGNTGKKRDKHVLYLHYMLTLKAQKTFSICLGLLFSVLGFTDDPMGFTFAIWMFGLAFMPELQNFFSRYSPLKTFFFLGVSLGIFVEICAIISNLDVPEAERVLLSGSPGLDIVFGLFYYGLLMLVWTFLVHLYPYTEKEVFVLAGLLGIATEEVGGVFVRMVTDPIGFGGAYALIIFCIYGIFPYLAFRIVKKQLRPKYPSASKIKRYTVCALGLFIFIALYGNYILPYLRQVFEA